MVTSDVVQPLAQAVADISGKAQVVVRCREGGYTFWPSAMREHPSYTALFGEADRRAAVVFEPREAV